MAKPIDPKKKKSNITHMQAIEPRILLNADLLGLAGLPGAEQTDDNTFENLASDLSTFNSLESYSPFQEALNTPNPIVYSNQNGEQEGDEVLNLPAFQEELIIDVKQVVIIDQNTPDYQILLDNITQNNEQSLLVYMINNQSDGIEQISSILAQHQDLSAIHIISHGAEGEISLGNSTLDSNNILDYANELQAWANVLNADADILLYGCDVASNQAGIDFTTILAELTGADIAASDDLTGHETLKADWELEYHVGQIEAKLVLNNDNDLNWINTLGPTQDGLPFLVNTTLSDKQDKPAVAIHDDGSYIVVWESRGGDSSDDGILMQLYNSDGSKNGGEILVNTMEVNSQKDPSIDMNDSGDFVIAWKTKPGSDDDISVRVFNADGTPKSFNASSEIVVDNSNNIQTSPDVAIDDSGRFVVVWHGDRGDLGDSSGVFLQRYDSTGNKVGTVERVNNSFTSNIQSDARIAMNDNGDFVVVFEDGDANNNSRISANLYNWGSGSTLTSTGNFVVNDVYEAQKPDVGVDNSGNFVVTWSERVGGDSDDDKEIYYKRFDNLGNSLDLNPVKVNLTYNNYDQVNASISMQEDGDFVITWTTKFGGYWDDDIYAQAFLADGTRSGSELTVFEDINNQRRSEVAINNNGDFVVVWDGWSIIDSEGIYGQKYQWSDATAGLAPTFTAFSGPVDNTPEDTEVEITYTELINAGNEADADGSVDAFIVKSVSSGTLKIGTSAATATAWAAGTNDVINSTLRAYWTPAQNSNGVQNAFKVTARDNDLLESNGAVDVTVDVAPVNDPAAGLPIITGTAQEDETLTADVSGITDEDGVGNFNYQWLRNGVAISGAVTENYTLGDQDVDQLISVQVTFTDLEGNNEGPLTSAQTAAVLNVNDAPTGSVEIDNMNPAQGSVLTASNNILDIDGISEAITYQWQRNGVDIGGATGSTYTTVQADVGATIRVVASYTDDQGTNESVISSSTAAVLNINDTPTGDVLIDNMSPSQGDTLTASNTLVDPDGISGPITYQWQRNGVNIAGATNSTYITTQADVGEKITVVATYTDDFGSAEVVSSALSDPVLNVNDAPVGVPVIVGTIEEDQTLTADISGISDLDGIGTIQYQWLRNGNPISGATNSSYTLGDNDVDQKIRVQVTYTDLQGTNEGPLLSTETAKVLNINDAPNGGVFIDNMTPSEGAILTATDTISDPDGISKAIDYQWQRDGVDISGETGSNYTTTAADVGATIRVVASYTDMWGTFETVYSANTSPITNVNNSPTGTVTIDNMTPSQGDTLTASNTLADLDGLSGPISYQWQKDGVNIAGATNSTYTLTQADVGGKISVVASYTDDLGTNESKSSTQTAAVADINDPAAGVPIINGIAQEDETLSANTTAISDVDGIGTFSYQWLRNGIAINGATSSTYTLGDLDVGQLISVQVSFTDQGGNAEGPLTSAQTGPINNVNDAPAGTVSINNMSPSQGSVLTASNTISDDDGISGAITYQWQRNGVNIAGATNITYTTVQADVGASIQVIASYIDDQGQAESVTSNSTASVLNINDSPTGNVTINNTTPDQGDVLTASHNLSDADGISGAINYQWQRDGVNISGATGTTYTTTQDDVGKQIRVIASYTDNFGASEVVNSGQTATVGNINDSAQGLPTIIGTVQEDQTLTADTSGITDLDGVGDFIYRWYRNGASITGAVNQDYTLSDQDVGQLISVRVFFTDLLGTFEGPLTSAQTAAVANVNDAPNGVPNIIGIPLENSTLTANTLGISDADGVGTMSYQWLRNGNAITGATNSTYTLGDDDVGKQISVQVSYMDLNDTQEGPITSAQTTSIVNLNDAPQLVTNDLSILPGGSTNISASMLLGTDVDNNNDKLIFTISSLTGGHFELTTDPGTAISQFSQADVNSGRVVFIDDGDTNLPSFNLNISDGDLSTNETANLSFSEPPVVSDNPTDFVPLPDITLPEENLNEPEEELVIKPEKEEEEIIEEKEEKEDGQKADEVKADKFEDFINTSPEEDDVNEQINLAEFANAQELLLYQPNEDTTQVFYDNAYDIKNIFSSNLVVSTAITPIVTEIGNWANDLDNLFSEKSFDRDFDRIRENFDDADNLQKHQVASSIAVSTGFSVGYVIWLLRSGALLSTVLSSLPAWQFIDPLPILGTVSGKGTGKGTNEEEDDLEGFFDEPAQDAKSKANTKTEESNRGITE